MQRNSDPVRIRCRHARSSGRSPRRLGERESRCGLFSASNFREMALARAYAVSGSVGSPRRFARKRPSVGASLFTTLPSFEMNDSRSRGSSGASTFVIRGGHETAGPVAGPFSGTPACSAVRGRPCSPRCGSPWGRRLPDAPRNRSVRALLTHSSFLAALGVRPTLRRTRHRRAAPVSRHRGKNLHSTLAGPAGNRPSDRLSELGRSTSSPRIRGIRSVSWEGPPCAATC